MKRLVEIGPPANPQLFIAWIFSDRELRQRVLQVLALINPPKGKRTKIDLLRRELKDVQRRYEYSLTRLNPNHPSIKQLKSKIDELRSQLSRLQPDLTGRD